MVKFPHEAVGSFILIDFFHGRIKMVLPSTNARLSCVGILY